MILDLFTFVHILLLLVLAFTHHQYHFLPHHRHKIHSLVELYRIPASLSARLGLQNL